MISILLVDDSEFDRTVLSRALTAKTNYQMLQATSGEKCLEIISNQKIDLILLDVMMPDMDGNQLLAKIREKFNAVELPIVMITGKTEAADIINSLKLGANDYIAKPVNFEVARMRISTHLKIAELSKEMSKLEQISALHAIVATYNHEINNPLAIAIANLTQLGIDRNADEALKNAEEALWRISDIVTKIRKVTEDSHLQFVDYSGGQKMLKVK